MGPTQQTYIFERDEHIPEGSIQQTVSVRAQAAIVAAAADQPEIRHEELTDPSNPYPVIAVVFADPELAEPFANRLVECSNRYGVRFLRCVSG
jgi:hypothetical protein